MATLQLRAPHASRLSRTQSVRPGRTRHTVHAAAAEATAVDTAREVFERLASQVCTDVKVTVGQGPFGNGLVLTQDVKEGEVVIRIPRATCIGVDYDVGGLIVPEGPWPRLQAALEKDDSMPWDLLLAVALLDGLAASGTLFWQEYTNMLLPSADSLCLPMCWSPERLQELQHPAVAEAAVAQQERLHTMFSGLSQPMGPDQPSWMQWGFACVRSRAFQVGPQAFAFIPFLDLANHESDPSCNYRSATVPRITAPGLTDSTAASTAESPNPEEIKANMATVVIELVARRDLKAGEQATISYTGVEGVTNQRMMAQYGFVPAGGNVDDRVELEVAEGAALSLARIQQALGDALFKDAVQRTNKTLFAALKSLPVAELGDATGPVTEAEQQLVEQLKQQCQAQQQECAATTTAEDEAALEAATAAGDMRLAAAVRYRLERKKLLRTCTLLLDIYLR